MANYIDLLQEGNLIEFKSMVGLSLISSLEKHISDRKQKVIAEMFSREPKPLTESQLNSQKPQVVTPIQDLIHTTQKYGFEPYHSQNTPYGKVHTFTHSVGGHQVHLHQTRKKSYWSHHVLGEDGSYTNMGNGDSPKELRNHLSQVFPKPGYRQDQVENILNKYGDDLMEALSTVDQPKTEKPKEKPQSKDRVQIHKPYVKHHDVDPHGKLD